MEKVEEYARKGKHAHFLIIDEDGRHTKKVPGEWKPIQVGGKRSYWLHKYEPAKKKTDF